MGIWLWWKTHWSWRQNISYKVTKLILFICASLSYNRRFIRCFVFWTGAERSQGTSVNCTVCVFMYCVPAERKSEHYELHFTNVYFLFSCCAKFKRIKTSKLFLLWDLLFVFYIQVICIIHWSSSFVCSLITTLFSRADLFKSTERFTQMKIMLLRRLHMVVVNN